MRPSLPKRSFVQDDAKTVPVVPVLRRVLVAVRYAAILGNGVERATADNTVKVTVDVVEPMGSEVYLYLLSGKKVFVGRLDSRTQVQPGQSIEIVWDMTKIHLFEKETQAALV